MSDDGNAFTTGGRVSYAAKSCDIQWARKYVGMRWKTARVHEVIREVLGKRSHKILVDGNDDPLQSA